MTVLLLIKNISLKVKKLLFNFCPGLNLWKYRVSLVESVNVITMLWAVFRSLIKIWYMATLIFSPHNSPACST